MSGRPVRRTVLKEIDEDMRFVRQIGAGDQGVAKLFQRTRDGRLFVRKSYHENTPGRLPHEGFILSSAIAPHPRILKIVGFQRASGSGANLFFQYCEGGNLKDFAREYGRGLPEPFVWHIFVQMAEALALIHYCVGSPLIRQDSWRSVMHLDIKPDNIFLLKKINHPREVPKLVLGDFGLAALSNQTARRVGPSYWQGPEWPRASRKTDIWALGAIIHWLCHGRGPIDPRPEYASTPKDEWAEDPDVKNPQPLPEEYSEPLNRVMMACFRRDPRRRIDSSDLLPLVEEGREIFHYQYS